nr:Fic family protein [Fusobacterium necrophorum]
MSKEIKNIIMNFNKEEILDYNFYVNLHQKLFHKVYPEIAGEVRMSGTIQKSEPLLNGKSIQYATGKELLFEGKNFIDKFETELKEQRINKREQITFFIEKIRSIWQKHYFFEGNTRTTALYTDLMAIKYDIPFQVTRGNISELRNGFVLATAKNEYSKLYSYFNNNIREEQKKNLGENFLVEKILKKRENQNNNDKGLKK